MSQENIHECLYNPREGQVFLKGFLNVAVTAEVTSEVFMHFYYIKVKNKFLNANSQSS